jgi:hypothetical protein
MSEAASSVTTWSRGNDARDGSSSSSNRRDQFSLNGFCTAMYKTNGKTTTLSLFLDSLFPETEIPCMRILGDRRGYSHLKKEALDRIKWRNRFGGGCGHVTTGYIRHIRYIILIYYICILYTILYILYRYTIYSILYNAYVLYIIYTIYIMLYILCIIYTNRKCRRLALCASLGP